MSNLISADSTPVMAGGSDQLKHLNFILLAAPIEIEASPDPASGCSTEPRMMLPATEY